MRKPIKYVEKAVTVVAKGFAHPWSLAFLPDQSMLVTERDGRLRLVRHGKLEAQPVSGAPTVFVANLWGLMDVALHPRFAENRLVYLSYLKPSAAGRGGTLALARGRLEGNALSDVADIFVADPPTAGSSRIAFGRDGSLFVTTTCDDMRAQDPSDLVGAWGERGQAVPDPDHRQHVEVGHGQVGPVQARGSASR